MRILIPRIKFNVFEYDTYGHIIGNRIIRKNEICLIIESKDRGLGNGTRFVVLHPIHNLIHFILLPEEYEIIE